MKQGIRISKRLAVVLVAVSIGGCQTTSDGKSDGMLGAGLGALAGGLIGSQIGGGKGKILAVLGGAALGALIGSKFEQYLNEQDQKTLAENTQATAVSGSTQTWKNPDTGVSGVTRVKSSSQQQQQAQVRVLKDAVSETPPIEFVNSMYDVQKNSNVRSGPGTDYKVVNSLRAGNSVTVLGKVIDENWYMISEGGVGAGYVYAPLLAKSDEVMPEPAPAGPTPSADDVVEVTIASGRTCRIVSQEVTLADGATQADEITVCNGPDGWEIV